MTSIIPKEAADGDAIIGIGRNDLFYWQNHYLSLNTVSALGKSTAKAVGHLKLCLGRFKVWVKSHLKSFLCVLLPPTIFL